MNAIVQRSLKGPMRISVLGEIQVDWENRRLELPTSKKTRALLAYLIMTRRTVRRERLCELFWDLPSDPRASLRWALWKIRSMLDTPDSKRLIADRERVGVIMDDVEVDYLTARRLLSEDKRLLSVADLQMLAEALAEPLLDGLDGAGDEVFDAWLTSEREDARQLHATALRCLARHVDLDPLERVKWAQKWWEAVPFDATAASEAVAAYRATGRTDEANAIEQSFRRDATDASIEIPSGFGLAAEPKTTGEPLRSADSCWPQSAQSINFCKSRDGVNIAYATAGTGPPLVMASGGLSHLELGWQNPIWGKTHRALSKEFQLVRYDGRGSGLSDWNVPEISLATSVRDLETVVDTLGLERFPLIGYSHSCAVAIEYAARHPERVSSLILSSGFATGWRIGASPEEEVVDEALLTLIRNGWTRKNPAYRQILSQMLIPDARAEDLNWLNEFQRKATSAANAARFLEIFGRVDLTDRLQEIAAPTIVFHARGDQYISIDEGRKIAIGIPNAELVPLESQNHILLETERAWETCHNRIASFLAGFRFSHCA
ncbi:MAG: alpha/beta fold hydrolase [Pseudomonadota bacterium]